MVKSIGGKVVCTISPVLLREPHILKDFHENGMSIARINGSYGTKDEIHGMITILKKSLPRGVKILLDLPGNKIRIRNLKRPLAFKAGQEITLKSDNFTYEGFLRLVKKGDIFSCSDGTVKMRVVSVKKNSVCFSPLVSGVLLNGKGMNIPNIHHGLPFIFERDIELISVAIDGKIDLLGLSFVRRAEHVRRIKSQLTGKGIVIVAKIETKEAVEKLEDILEFAEYIMLDRGDLEAEIERSQLPLVQKEVIARCRKHGKPVIVASQFIPSLVNSELPKLSEVSDIANAFLDGADYVMLSEETAIGRYPLEAIKSVSDVGMRVERYLDKNITVKILAAGFSSDFGSLTTHKHKCLLDVGGQTIIEHQLENISMCGISSENVQIITGYNYLQLEEYIKSGIHKSGFVYNPWYLSTNLLVSLWMSGRPDGACVVLYGDIVFDRNILCALLRRRDDFCLVVDKKNKFDAEDEKVIIRKDKIIRIGKDLDTEMVDAEFIGLAKFSETGSKLLYEEMNRIIRGGNLMTFITQAFENLITAGHEIGFLETRGRPWADNDTLVDLKYTQNEIFPRIRKAA